MFVYFLSFDCNKLPAFYVKIGVSANINKRIKELQTGSPWPIKLIAKLPCTSRAAAMHREKQFHNAYARKRQEGEWFSFKDERYFNRQLARLSEHDDYIERHTMPDWHPDALFNSWDKNFMESYLCRF